MVAQAKKAFGIISLNASKMAFELSTPTRITWDSRRRSRRGSK
jgi:hypothetical protein